MTPALDGMSVLLVEDEYLQARAMQAALERQGARVVGPYGNATAAIDALKQDRPDCAVVDINLGDGPHFDLATIVRDMDVPFIFLTGYDPEVITLEFADIERLQKPVVQADLVAALSRLRHQRLDL